MEDKKIEIVDNVGEVSEVSLKKPKAPSQYVNFTLRFPKYIESCGITIENDLIEKTLKTIGCNYFYILHDSDTDTYVHYHVVVILDKKKTTNALLKYIVNNFCPFANFKEINNLFEVKPCFSLYGAIQYLTHKNFSDKFQYDVSRVNSNNFQLFNLYYNNADTELLLEDVDNIINASGGSYKFIIFKMGMKQFIKYYRVIDKLYKFYYGDKDKTIGEFEE